RVEDGARPCGTRRLDARAIGQRAAVRAEDECLESRSSDVDRQGPHPPCISPSPRLPSRARGRTGVARRVAPPAAPCRTKSTVRSHVVASRLQMARREPEPRSNTMSDSLVTIDLDSLVRVTGGDGGQ